MSGVNFVLLLTVFLGLAAGLHAVDRWASGVFKARFKATTGQGYDEDDSGWDWPEPV